MIDRSRNNKPTNDCQRKTDNHRADKLAGAEFPVVGGEGQSERSGEEGNSIRLVRIRMVSVPKRIESANHFMTAHWRRYWLYKRSWHAALHLIFRSPGSGYEKPESVTVRIVSKRKRILDFDNLVNGCKPILDWLKVAGWIIDDSPKHLELIVSQCSSKLDETTIELLHAVGNGTSTRNTIDSIAQSYSDGPKPEQLSVLTRVIA